MKISWLKIKNIVLKPKFFLFLAILVFAGLLTGGWFLYLRLTKVVPVEGGIYSEGMVGQPKYINPILASGQIDIDISSLIYSGLTRFDQQGKIIPDIAYKWEESKNHKTYTFYLRDNIYWHDGEKLTADDIVFTISLIQHPNYNGPLVQAWEGIKVKKINNFKIAFSLPSPYPYFLDNTTLGILPKHLFKTIEAEELTSAPFNLNPIGSGPFQFEKFDLNQSGEIKSFNLIYNPKWYLKKPYIQNIVFKFYPNPRTLLEGYQKREFLGFSYIPFDELGNLKKWRNLNLYSVSLPQYAAVFINQKSKLFSDKNIRLALAYATNRSEIISDALSSEARPCFSPLLPEFVGYSAKIKEPNFDLTYANKILERNGFVDKNKDGVREKGKIKLQASLIVLDNPTFVKVAQVLQEQWEGAGIKINLKIVGNIDLQNYLEERNYNLILYGQNLGRSLDLYSYWHSLQSEFPGLNLSCFKNSKIDSLLEETHNLVDSKTKSKKYQEISKIITSEIPAIFLFSPNFLFGADKKVRGIELGKIILPSDRFFGFEDWYVDYKRVKK